MDADERQLLDAYRAAKTPDEGAVARALAATLHRVEHGPPVVLPEPVREASAWPRVAMFAIAAAAVVVLAWRGLEAMERRQGDAPEIAPMVAEPESSASDVQPREPESPSIDRTTIVEDRPTGDPRRAGPIEPEPPRVAQPAPKRKPSGGTDLAAELALLREADTALDQGNASKALKLLDEHARKFPRGQMIPERLLQKAIAFCKLGKQDKSRATIEKLLRTYPSTPLRARASEVCR
jgi:hypothetical protein